LAVRRPMRLAFDTFEVGETMRCATCRRDYPDMALLGCVAVGLEDDPLSIGRVNGLFIFAGAEGKLARMAALRGDEPNLIPVGFL
jgi:hypothetical protein